MRSLAHCFMRYLLFIGMWGAALQAQVSVGTHGVVGCLEQPKQVSRLEITKPGVYENYRIDAQGKSGNTVKITANEVTVRNCEIFNGSGNAIGIFGTNVVIENCRIHHMLTGSFRDQKDSHGISGRWGAVTIRNCDISFCSGDCIQFDPDRASQGSILIEGCHLWNGPLTEDRGGFKAGERAGENAVDTKTKPDGERCKLTIRNCHMHGFNQPAPITTTCPLNLKENVDALIEHCVFNDNEVALRLRGPGKRGGAHVIVRDCAIYDAAVGVRAEDKIEVLELNGLSFGSGVKSRIEFHNGKATSGFVNQGEHEAPALEAVLKNGFGSAAK